MSISYIYVYIEASYPTVNLGGNIQSIIYTVRVVESRIEGSTFWRSSRNSGYQPSA